MVTILSRTHCTLSEGLVYLTFKWPLSSKFICQQGCWLYLIDNDEEELIKHILAWFKF